MEYQFHIVADNRIIQDEAEKCSTSQCSKKAPRITKQGRYFEKIVSTVANVRSDTNTTKYSIDSIIQGILVLSDENLKDTFLHLGEKY